MVVDGLHVLGAVPWMRCGRAWRWSRRRRGFEFAVDVVGQQAQPETPACTSQGAGHGVIFRGGSCTQQTAHRCARHTRQKRNLLESNGA
jgi:hypothetical protein